VNTEMVKTTIARVDTTGLNADGRER